MKYIVKKYNGRQKEGVGKLCMHKQVISKEKKNQNTTRPKTAFIPPEEKKIVRLEARTQRKGEDGSKSVLKDKNENPCLLYQPPGASLQHI